MSDSMDPEVSLLLHCADWKGLRKSQVQVELSERFNRQTDAALENHIKKMWTKRLSQEPWIFNGAKFRLHSFMLNSPKKSNCTELLNAPNVNYYKDQESQLNSRQMAEDFPVTDSSHQQNSFDQVDAATSAALASSTCECSGENATTGLTSASAKTTVQEESGYVLTLRLGLTSYKDYLGTNWSRQAEELHRRGEVEFGDPLSLFAQPLGVGAVLCTVDEQVVLIRRSQRVAEAGGLLDIPGGHPEPKVVCELLGETICEEKISMAMLQQCPDAVVSELFSSVCAEIRDEVNVPLTFLGEPILLGIALNHTSAGRPSAEFYISCSLTSDQVKKLYWKGGAEAHESTDITFLNKKNMLELDQTSPLWSELCPSAKGAILLYQTVKPDGKEDYFKQPPTQ